MEPAPGPIPLLDHPQVVPPGQALRSWSVADVRMFLCARELCGLAEVCFTNDMNGEDLANLEADTVVSELHVTPFQAKKLMGARAAFLAGHVGDGRSGR